MVPDDEPIQLTLELEPTRSERRFRAKLRESGSDEMVFESALDLVEWLEARSGRRESSGLR